MLSQNSLITNFPQNIFLCVQNKRIHTGLDLLSAVFIFGCTVPLKFKQRQVCIMLLYIIISRDAPVDRPKIGTGRFLLIMRDVFVFFSADFSESANM